MASKTGLEYEVRGVDIDTDGSWEKAHARIKKACAAMDLSGWELSTMAWPQLGHAVLVFTRPRKRD